MPVRYSVDAPKPTAPVVSSQFTKGNFYVDTILPAQKERWMYSYNQAVMEAKSEENKMAIRAAMLKQLDDRIVETRKIQADLQKQLLISSDDAQKQAAAQIAEVRLEKLKGIMAAQRSNAETGRAVESAKIQAEGNIIAAGQTANIGALRTQREGDKQTINDAAQLQQQSKLKPALSEFLDIPIGNIRANDPNGIPALQAGIRNIIDQAQSHNLPVPWDSIAQSVAGLKGYSSDQKTKLSDAVAQAVQSSLGSPNNAAEFTERYHALADDLPKVEPNTAGLDYSASSGMINAGNVGKLKTPEEAPGDYQHQADIRKLQADLISGDMTSKIDDEISMLEAQKDKALQDALGEKNPDLVQRARELYWNDFPSKTLQLPSIGRPGVDPIGGKFPLGRGGSPPPGGASPPSVPAPQFPVSQVQAPAQTSSDAGAIDDFLSRLERLNNLPMFGGSVSGGPVYPPRAGNYPGVAEPLALPGGGPLQVTPDLPIGATSRMLNAIEAGKNLKKPEMPADMPKPDQTSAAPPGNPVALKAFQDAHLWSSQPSKANRILTQDPVAQAVSGIYAIDRRNNIPLVETAHKLIADYKDDPIKQQRAVAVLTYLYQRDNSLKLGSSSNGVTDTDSV